MWFVPANEDHDGVLYYLHGGGYVVGSLYTHQNLISGFSLEAGCRAFAIEYRTTGGTAPAAGLAEPVRSA